MAHTDLCGYLCWWLSDSWRTVAVPWVIKAWSHVNCDLVNFICSGSPDVSWMPVAVAILNHVCRAHQLSLQHISVKLRIILNSSVTSELLSDCFFKSLLNTCSLTSVIITPAQTYFLAASMHTSNWHFRRAINTEESTVPFYPSKEDVNVRLHPVCE